MGDCVELALYVDDFLIVGQREDDVNKALSLLKEKIRELGFKLNEKKSSANATTAVEWLGFTLVPNRIELDRNKQAEFKRDYEQIFKSPNI